MVDLRGKPFYLDDEAVRWVENTLSSMTLQEKIGQLFIQLGNSFDPAYLEKIVKEYHVGGVRYNPGSAREVYEQNLCLQSFARIPLLIASNLETGGDGACLEGTHVGTPVQIGAAGDSHYAYELGRISGIEGAAVGGNWSFAPIVDINYNWRNSVAATRCFADNPDTVLHYSLEYMRGIKESGMACAAKHFPGDGVDERDQHLLTSVNSFSCEEWDRTYGRVYGGLIDAGLKSIMAGHIMQPAYSRYFNPGIADRDILPASLSHELLTGLLRGKLGFEGVILTDASGMLGMNSAMPRRKLVPGAIAAGCDMFLFFNDPKEDIGFMMDGYENGVITEERLRDALTRILGLKASIGLHKKRRGKLLPAREGLSIIGCKEHLDVAGEVADRSITLVKNTEGQLPVTPEKYKRILLVMLGGESLFFGKDLKRLESLVTEELEASGFQVNVYESPVEKNIRNELPPPTFLEMLSAKESVGDFKSQYDAVFLFANVQGFGQQNPLRIKWNTPLGREIPWYVTELPTVFVSLNVPFHLADVPMVKTYINAYSPNRTCIRAAIDKITGKSEFLGISTVDPFCGFWDAKR